mgnify:CR=1 FL=1
MVRKMNIVLKKVCGCASLLVFALAAACADPNESLLMQYEDAMSKGEFERANEIIQRMDLENTTHEQNQRIINASKITPEDLSSSEESPEALPEIELPEE